MNRTRVKVVIRCNTCDGFPCLVQAKADAQVICIDPALKYENVEIPPMRTSRAWRPAPQREVTKIVVERNGEQILPANIVVSSCGAINSAAILLRSANDQHPKDWQTADMVSRNYEPYRHDVWALSRHRNDTKFNKTIGLNDFYFGTKSGVPNGPHFTMGNADANIRRGRSTHRPRMDLG
jgi:choline dehydrogenase-like flavoprotein